MVDIASIAIWVDPHICDSPTFVRWKRNHRKARINKKWRKRYGAEYRYCQGKAYRVAGMGVFCCPHTMEALKEACRVGLDSTIVRIGVDDLRDSLQNG